MNCWLVKPVGYLHANGLLHIAQAFADAFETELTVGCIPPSGRTLVFCGHLLGNVEPNMVIYNSEQISDEWLKRNPPYAKYLDVLKNASEVWDYSRNNIEELKKHGVIARLVEIGYMPSMTKKRPPVKLSTDILFYGSTSSERRMEILSDLKSKCKIEIAYGVYGDELDEMINRSKIVLNMHFYAAGIFEVFRCSYLMANRKCIVSEIGNDKQLEEKYYSSIMFADYEHLVKRCLTLLNSQDIRDAYGNKAFQTFTAKTQKDILKVSGLL